ncbi:hypothetical protein TPHA_0I01880 [Tetrapisispora phaffii CBS 4417]|uniref:TFIID subunit TAF5 NTD2 domain-containing protein n=1 Tax=Tetrapisispora phaffii (strain ATCC 24235 / CBS 4417 / NBRC 1672 / NRRL Y-8282 / UCD 70-5) TaxID=1071381 RepID=G8BXR4_TETPH|nr:hypothetical protein TPHA_0I01880 [Tetrapisispora phaffii CBS 4417]CCE64692.1 hypothetical protein TPHA_0I01880 [Tetrapisispora phaffii CBS 4417]
MSRVNGNTGKDVNNVADKYIAGSSMAGMNNLPSKTVPGKRIPNKMVPSKTVPGKRIPGKSIPGKTIAGKTVVGNSMVQNNPSMPNANKIRGDNTTPADKNFTLQANNPNVNDKVRQGNTINNNKNNNARNNNMENNQSQLHSQYPSNDINRLLLEFLNKKGFHRMEVMLRTESSRTLTPHNYNSPALPKYSNFISPEENSQLLSKYKSTIRPVTNPYQSTPTKRDSEGNPIRNKSGDSINVDDYRTYLRSFILLKNWISKSLSIHKPILTDLVLYPVFVIMLIKFYRLKNIEILKKFYEENVKLVIGESNKLIIINLYDDLIKSSNDNLEDEKKEKTNEFDQYNFQISISQQLFFSLISHLMNNYKLGGQIILGCIFSRIEVQLVQSLKNNSIELVKHNHENETKDSKQVQSDHTFENLSKEGEEISKTEASEKLENESGNDLNIKADKENDEAATDENIQDDDIADKDEKVKSEIQVDEKTSNSEVKVNEDDRNSPINNDKKVNSGEKGEQRPMKEPKSEGNANLNPNNEKNAAPEDQNEAHTSLQRSKEDLEKESESRVLENELNDKHRMQVDDNKEKENAEKENKDTLTESLPSSSDLQDEMNGANQVNDNTEDVVNVKKSPNSLEQSVYIQDKEDPSNDNSNATVNLNTKTATKESIKSTISVSKLQGKIKKFQELAKSLHYLGCQTSLPSVSMYTYTNTEKNMSSLDFSSDYTLAATGFQDSYIKIWSLEGTSINENEQNYSQINSIFKTLVGHSDAVYSVNFSPCNRFLLSGSGDKTARLWSTDTYKGLVSYKGHEKPIWDVNFSPTGNNLFATASSDNTARVWSCDRVYPVRILAGHLSDVDCVSFHPNGQYVFTGSSDKTSRMWDLSSGDSVRLFIGHSSAVTATAVSPDGRWLSTANEDGTITVWDIGSGKKLKSMRGHGKNSIYSLSYNKTGNILVSSGADNSVRVWDIKKNTHEPSLEPEEIYPGLGNDNVTSMNQDIKEYGRRRTIVATNDLMATYFTKKTPVYKVKYTSANLLLAGGASIA